MYGGYTGKVLWVDLSSGKISREELDERLCWDFIGGYGIGAKTIYDRQKPHVDPLGPDNILGFLAGPLTGTPALIGSRFVVVGKSPLTGTWGDANCGGHFGPNLKFAGYDAVYCTGRADKPVYLLIDDGTPKLKDASHLWGKDTIQTRDWFKAEYGPKAEEACIGPAGENQSLISCIINDYGRAAGRSGLGAVMGSKRLKALVVRGAREVPLANTELVLELRHKYLRERGPFQEFLNKFGTCGNVARHAMSGDSPVKNWTGAGPVDFPTASKISDGAVIAEQERKYACWHCPVACGGHMKPKPGRAKVSHKPEYETLCAAGTICLNDDIESIIHFNDIVNMYGLDSISAGATIAFAMECYEHGIIDVVDTDGLDLRWGNSEALLALCRKMARREGFGAILADGSKRAAERIGRGAEQFAVQVQGQELAMHDPRFWPGLATTYQLDATPGRHSQGSDLCCHADFGYRELEKHNYHNKGEMLKKAVCSVHVCNAAGLCLMGFLGWPLQCTLDFVNAVTGWNVSLDELLVKGERIANIRHAFNLREGLNPLRFAMPGIAVGNPPLTKGNLAGITIDTVAQITDYLGTMSWDPATAVPSLSKLEELGLAYIAEDLPS